MDFQSVWTATLAVGIVGLVIAILLSILGKVLAVESDERIDAVREVLPGNNCGGCGLAGCDACAKAIVEGTVPVTVCPVGGAECAEKIAEIMGVEAGHAERKVAFVHCSGNRETAPVKANYTGAQDCHAAAIMGGAGRSCEFGCYGLGSCVKACQFDAIHVFDGLANVDKEACTACGRCVEACPQKLISLEPADAIAEIVCSSHYKGKTVMEVCSAGCIACGICARTCPVNAIEMVDNLPIVDQEKCVRCGVCVSKCPRKVIHFQ